MTNKQETRLLKIIGLSVLINICLIFLGLPLGLGAFIAGLSLGLLICKIK